MRFGLAPEVVNKIVASLAAFPNIEIATVFGSRAIGNFRKGSDIDIAIVGKDKKKVDILDLAVRLDELNLPYKIDLVDLNSTCNQNLLNHIEKCGIDLFRR